MSTSRKVRLLAADGSEVEATLHSDVSKEDMTTAEQIWTPKREEMKRALDARGVTSRPQSLHWRWSEKKDPDSLLAYQAFGIQVNGSWEGLMQVHTLMVSRLEATKGKPLVYVDFVESAPWNWDVPGLGQTAKYRGIGSLLLREAILYSDSQSFASRIALHSLDQAEGFYEKACGFTPVGRDKLYMDLMWFEATTEQAQAFLSKGKKGKKP